MLLKQLFLMFTFLHSFILYLFWVTAFSLKLLGEGGFCVLPLFFLILCADF